ncbi:hypothetical protein XELAEV_18010120mg [Xenopus laevis]|uniref:Uncharacterized protein n=1 Tax=Xenopus laevis TaxID=8355 RepID=A0A974DW06_XENLA|nr:hypothetical protein XELAEV_18010120mg [Xenopus laevis]
MTILIAAEVARLINPVIETTIGKAIDKLQIKISDISGKLSTHDKRFEEIEDAVSQIQDKTIDPLSRIDSLEKQTQELKLKIFLPSGARVFTDPGEASTFTSQLEKKSIGNLVSDTTSNTKFSVPPKDQRWKRYEKLHQSSFSIDSISSGKSRSRSRSPRSPRTSNPPHSSEEDMISDT